MVTDLNDTYKIIMMMIRNVANERNVDNVVTDIKCHTSLEPQAPADLNNDGNVRKGWNVWNVGHNSGRD